MITYKKFIPSTIFSGEIILSEKSYPTYEEAKKNTSQIYPDIDWEEYDENGRMVQASY